MKKFGFTLAEVLVTLGIIGVISALTIPTFVSNSENRAHAAKLSATITAVEDAFSSMMASDAVQEFAETEFVQAPTAANLGLHLKLSGNAASIGDYYGASPTITTLSSPGASLLPDFDIIFQLKNGALLFYDESENATISVEDAEADGLVINESVATLAIDVNGDEGPNRWGRDIFQFMVGNDGILYPAGGLAYARIKENNVSNVWSNNGSLSCIPGGSRTEGCTARLIENNYKIDY